MWLEREWRFQQFASLFLEVNLEIFVRIIFSVPFVQLRLRIKQVHLARPAMLKEANHRFGFAWEVGRFRGQRMKTMWRVWAGPFRLDSEQMRQCEIAEPAGGVAEK